MKFTTLRPRGIARVLVLLFASCTLVIGQFQDLDCSDPNSSGIFLPHPTDCQKYLNCWQGLLIEGSCPLGLYFDLERQVCESEARVRCTMNVFDPERVENYPIHTD
uniref:Chitin-binding type-2 domain-containing protein n=1 Tax=Anopheles funestus TaxID=62324 RepID=A0A182RSB3_ANOFN